MYRRENKHYNLIVKSLELTGKPLLFLFTIVAVALVTYLHLLTYFTQKIISSLHRPRLPHFTFPTLSLPYFRYSIFLFFVPVLAIGFLFYWYILKDLPSVTLLADSPPALSTKIYDRHGTLLYQIYKDQNRSLIHLSDLPQHLIDATLAAEDKNFYHHPGIDISGIIRATYKNFVNCKLKIENCSIQGGSSITQQLLKNTLLTPERTLSRKLKEVVLALQTERLYTKDQILEMYFNQVPYGGTAYGIEEAAVQYLGKHASSLNLAESSFLAGLPVSPTALSPFGTSPYLGKIRQQQVLESMVAEQWITENLKLATLADPLSLNSDNTSIRAPHFVMYVRDLLVKQYGESRVSRGGLSVTTTLDLDFQDTLQEEINAELTNLKNLRVGNAAGLVTRPGTGEILAMVGSHDFFDTAHDGQVNVTLQPRQPGSSIKPLTYTLAFLRGLSPSSMIDDSPVCFSQVGSPDYCPKNYDGRFHGSITLRTALGSSYNIPAIKLLNSLGVNNLVTLAREMGIRTWDDSSRFGLSLTLGGGEITMLDMSVVYGVFANNGSKVPLSPILSVIDAHGAPLPPYPLTPTPIRVIPESVAFQINSILSDPVARAPAFGTRSILSVPGRAVAVKTGTTNNLRDNWTFGYTPDLLVATWVGNNDNTPMSSIASGITGASPIWSRTMAKLLAGQSNLAFTPPDNIIKVNVSCGSPRYEYFVRGAEPKLDCSKTGEIL